MFVFMIVITWKMPGNIATELLTVANPGEWE